MRLKKVTVELESAQGDAFKMEYDSEVREWDNDFWMSPADLEFMASVGREARTYNGEEED